MPNEPEGQTAILGPDFPPQPTRRDEHWVEELVGALTDPIIVYPGGGWENDLPDNLKRELPIHRLAHLMKCAKGRADMEEVTDLEALLYLYPASMAAPMGDQWSRIYLCLGARVMGDKCPEDIREKDLGQYDLGELRRLKRWIKSKKVETRALRRRQEKDTQAKPEVRAERCEQIKFF